MLTDFINFFTDVFWMKFATKSLSYILPHFKDVTLLPCKTQKIETGKILLHITQLLFNVHRNNKYDRQIKYALYEN